MSEGNDTATGTVLYEWCQPRESDYCVLTVLAGGAEAAVLDHLIELRNELGANCLELDGWLCRQDEPRYGSRVHLSLTSEPEILDLEASLELIAEDLVDVEYEHVERVRAELSERLAAKLAGDDDEEPPVTPTFVFAGAIEHAVPLEVTI